MAPTISTVVVDGGRSKHIIFPREGVAEAMQEPYKEIEEGQWGVDRRRGGDSTHGDEL